MPIEPQGGYPDDWHVPPSAQGDSFPDDWHVPPSAQGDGFPDDWSVPPSAAPGAAQAAPIPQPGAMASRTPTPPASDFFAAFLPFMPATRAAMGAWGQPLSDNAFGQFPPSPAWPPALPPPPPAGGALGSQASSQLATDAPPFTSTSLFGGVAAPRPESSDASPYSMLFGGLTAPKAESSDPPWDSNLFGGAVAPNPPTGNAPSPALAADGTFSTTLPAASGNIGRPPVSSRLLVAASEGGDREDEERRKFQTPEVMGGLTEPGLWSPKQPPTLPSIPPLDAPPAGTEAWGLPPTKRGRALEPIFGHNLHPNNPTIDRWGTSLRDRNKHKKC